MMYIHCNITNRKDGIPDIENVASFFESCKYPFTVFVAKCTVNASYLSIDDRNRNITFLMCYEEKSYVVIIKEAAAILDMNSGNVYSLNIPQNECKFFLQNTVTFLSIP